MSLILSRLQFALRAIILFIVCTSISACGFLGYIPGMGKVIGEEGLFRDSQADYLEAETIPRTKVPDGLDAYILDDLLVVPNSFSEEGEVVAFLEVPRPPALNASSASGVVIQRMGDENWVVIDASAGEVWPRVKDYWSSNGVGMAFEDPTQGILETQWFIQDEDKINKDKVRVIVSAGFQDNSAEIKMLHFSLPQSTPTLIIEDVWPETSTDPEVEYDFLTRLSNYLFDVADLYRASSVSFLAGNIPSKGKAAIITDSSGESLLRLESGFSRSWAAVGRALDRAGAEVLSQDISTGTYQVRYTIDHSEGDEPGFFGKVFTLNGLLSSSAGDIEVHSLQVQLTEAGSNIEVVVQSPEAAEGESEDESEQFDAEVTKQAEELLLNMIRNFIT